MARARIAPQSAHFRSRPLAVLSQIEFPRDPVALVRPAYRMASLVMLRKPAFVRWARQFGTAVAPSAVALLVAGCATSPQTYRLKAEIGDPLGFPQGATATRGASRWTIERRVYTSGRTLRVRLSREDSLALDAAVADSALYARPQPRRDWDCIDEPLITLEVTADGSRRHLTLECETSPGLEAVLRILFDWPKTAGAAGEPVKD